MFGFKCVINISVLIINQMSCNKAPKLLKFVYQNRSYYTHGDYWWTKKFIMIEKLSRRKSWTIQNENYCIFMKWNMFVWLLYFSNHICYTLYQINQKTNYVMAETMRIFFPILTKILVLTFIDQTNRVSKRIWIS